MLGITMPLKNRPTDWTPTFKELPAMTFPPPNLVRYFSYSNPRDDGLSKAGWPPSLIFVNDYNFKSTYFFDFIFQTKEKALCFYLIYLL
jgi:hypothetical protein